MEEIRFWRTNETYGFMSNFSYNSFFADGFHYKTSEHYYQSYKFSDPELRAKIRLLDSPREAADFGRCTDFPIRDNWDIIKDSIMYEAIYCKFDQNQGIKNKLIATGDKILIEDSPYDYYWGCGKNGTGKNMLGVLLMKLRQELIDRINS